MTLDAVFLPLAQSMINRFGKIGTYISVSQGAYNLSDGTVAMADDQTEIKCVLSERNNDRYSAGLAQERALTVLAAGADFLGSPAVGDKIIIDSDTMTIAAINKTYSGEFVALYTFDVKKE